MKKAVSILLCLAMLTALLFSVAPMGVAEDKPVTISLLSWWDESKMQASLDSFKAKHPNITIDFQFAPEGQPYVDRLKTMLVAGEAPDIFMIGGGWEEYQQKGYLTDITGQPFLSAFNDAGLAATQMDGKQYGIPVDSWFGGLWVNTTLTDKVGVKVPFETFDDMVAGFEKLKQAGIAPLGVPGGAKDRYVCWLAMLMLNPEFYADAKNNVSFDKDAMLGKRSFAEWNPVFQKWYSLVEKGYYTKDMLGMANDEVMKDFATDKVAVMYGGNWNLADLKKANPDLKASLVPMPGSQPNNGWVLGGVGMSYAINSQTANQDACLKWLEHMSTAEGLQPLQQKLSCALFTKDIPYELDPMLNDVVPAFNAGHVYFPWNYWGANTNPLLFDTIYPGFQDVLSGSIGIDEIAVRLDKKIQDLMKK